MSDLVEMAAKKGREEWKKSFNATLEPMVFIVTLSNACSIRCIIFNILLRLSDLETYINYPRLCKEKNLFYPPCATLGNLSKKTLLFEFIHYLFIYWQWLLANSVFKPISFKLKSNLARKSHTLVSFVGWNFRFFKIIISQFFRHTMFGSTWRRFGDSSFANLIFFTASIIK